MENFFTLLVLVLIVMLIIRSRKKQKSTPERNHQAISKSDGSSVSISISHPETVDHRRPEDLRGTNCPNCGAELKKIPGAKTKCPKCSKFIFVRTDPRISARILVSEANLDEIDDEISKRNGTWEERLRLRTWREEIQQKWQSKGKSGMQQKDLDWAVLNQEGLWLAARGDWNAWRTNEFRMAEHVFKEAKFSNAFYHFCIVSISDYSDYVNRFSALELLEEDVDYLDFNVDDLATWLEPGLTRMVECIKRGQIAETDYHQLLEESLTSILGTGQIRASDIGNLNELIRIELKKKLTL